jgi:hypothetical protein
MYKYIRKTNFYFKENNNQKKKKKTFFKSSECTTGHDRESLLLLLGMKMLFLRPKGFLFFIFVSLPSWKEREIKTHLTHEWIGTLTVGPHNRIIKFKTFRKVENKSLFGGNFFGQSECDLSLLPTLEELADSNDTHMAPTNKLFPFFTRICRLWHIHRGGRGNLGEAPPTTHPPDFETIAQVRWVTLLDTISQIRPLNFLFQKICNNRTHPPILIEIKSTNKWRKIN